MRAQRSPGSTLLRRIEQRRRRLAALEVEVLRLRQLDRRVAELAELVEAVLGPAAGHGPAEVAERLDAGQRDG